MFCSNCGEELPETAYFCLQCGVKSSKGVEAGVSYPWNWEKEVKKALSTAAKEVEKAFGTVKESINKTIKKEPITCPNCGEKNQSDSSFCYKCGKAVS
ncbi:MAG: zinc-ribbon domain-containing protein [Candidatus Bathyarchaeota archaeon]|nr:MAG: zinc-ribbon domain-containing protein [Candidatus Bathyarchaeota archaeon]